MVVQADIVSSGKVRFWEEIAQTHHAETTRKVDFALTVERHTAVGTSTHASVRIEATFQLEASLQAATQVFYTLDAKA